ncbi:PBP1A family penicillin-binding protein [Desulfobacter latus]|uniref:PBP1A family penicillin-binding protein n=2 Tax=Desulfobacter latus TaxID=2292 RepID=A0A850SZF1_9BACT|nr:PBP1A family penicillin-binding protein [Desulfobacter latus]
MRWFSWLWLVSLVRLLFYTGLLAVGIMAAAVCLMVFHISGDLPKLPSPLSRIIETPQSLIYAADGQILISLGKKTSVSLDMVSADFLNAIVATEDHRFFEHHGVNKLRTFKALYITLFKPGRIEGASTITQQLAKNLFFSFEKTWQRKFKEMLVAFQIEQANTKEQILEAYINQIHFGAGAQGIERAARMYFDKPAQDLTLAEAALLAGLPKSPTLYNPFRHYDKALARRRVVLNRMVAAGFIPADEAARTDALRPALHDGRKDARTGSYFLDAMIQALVNMYGEDVVYHGGIKVYSTMDSRRQADARTAVMEGMARLDELMGLDKGMGDKPQAALVAIDNASGAIKAMVGGRDYYASEFNRAVNSRRQAGSGFKPFLYYAAFRDRKLHPARVFQDRPVAIPIKGAPDWYPRNFEKKYRGPMILKQALIHSVNTIAAQVVADVGPAAVVDVARACGIKSPLKPVYSLALGTSDVSVMDMAVGFSTLAGLGIYHEPFLFWRVEDARGRVLFEHIVKDRRVLDAATAFQVVDMMQGVVDFGSGRGVRRLGFKRPAAGKTGTTDNYNDAWFTGFTPSLCVSVWTGYDQKKKLKDKNRIGITGGRGALPIWTDFMIRAMKNEPERDFLMPPDIRYEIVEKRTGCLAGSRANMADDVDSSQPAADADSAGTIRVALKKGQEPCRRD